MWLLGTAALSPARPASAPSPAEIFRGTFSTMSRWLLLCALCACGRADPSSPEAITARAWDAHSIVIAAGEHARTCAEAGAAMQAAFFAHRQAFVDAIALDRDRARLEAATAYLEANEDRYRDLETRMAALSDRCAEEPTVQAAFDQMEAP